MKRFSDVDPPRALLAALTTVTFVLLVLLLSTSSTAFGVYNPTWDGTSVLRQEASEAAGEPVVLDEVTDYREADPTASVSILLSPDERYTDAEGAVIREYVRSGGTLIVAEDFGGEANAVLGTLGASARIDRRPVRDGQEFYRSPALPVATDVPSHPLTGGVSRLTLNHASVVRPNGARVLVRTSPYAYLDVNRNDSLDPTEEMGRYPIVTTERVGQGRVVVVSDPSLFINAMIERPDNREFVAALLSGYETVLLDYSHSGDIPPLTALQFTVQQSPVLRFALGILGIAAVALARFRLFE